MRKFGNLIQSVTLLMAIGWAMPMRPVAADLKLPSVFGDHMVLQQKQPVRIWGWAAAGEVITVSIGANSKSSTADKAGKWQVELPPMEANSTPSSITVKGNTTLEIKDVLVGEVWLCSGQSNMEWPVGASTNAAAEIAAAKFPLIRHIKVPLTQSTVPLDNFQSQWQVCSPETAGGFTACGYFMARKLHQELNVPVGLVNSSWGGTAVEPWTPPVGFQDVPALQGIYQSVMGRTPGTSAYKERLTSYLKSLEAWTGKAKAALESSEPLAPSPAYPAELTPFTSNQDPTMLYNGMIHSLVGFPIRGAIWYQGETNHGDGMLYLEKKKALIGGWRKLWKQGDFPFYYVQIAPYQYGNEDPTLLPKFWEAQAAVQQIPKTGMVVINDIATVGDIHPPNKQDVGLRLALLALKNDYGKQDIVANSPEFAKLETVGDKLKVTFKNAGGGLKTRNGMAPSHFEIIDASSNGFQPATAKIEGDAVILTSEKVKAPSAVRFAWTMLAEPNLAGGTGLPVGAFRAGEVPDFVSTLRGLKEYKLLYDLNLEKLAHDIVYDEDHSAELKSFDRIAYLLELRTSDGQEQAMFVSMKPFTNDPKKVGIPTSASQAMFQQPVEELEVITNVRGIESGRTNLTGNIEFWPHNYSQKNVKGVKNASDALYDCGDETVAPVDGYGSMQIHDTAAGKTLFAINHWSAGGGADIGIGNSPGDQARDWTFASNAQSYSSKRLRVFVRVK